MNALRATKPFRPHDRVCVVCKRAFRCRSAPQRYCTAGCGLVLAEWTRIKQERAAQRLRNRSASQ